MISEELRLLVVDNPMVLEGTRAWRRFVRSGVESGKHMNTAAIVFLGAIYAALNIGLVRERTDATSVLLIAQLITLTITVPVSMYSAISGEREKLTWDHLILTRLTPRQIVFGKILWRLVMAGILMLVFLPPMVLGHLSASGAFDWLRGGQPQTQILYAPRDICSVSAALFGEFLTLTWVWCIAAFSLWVSARTKRSVTSLTLVVGGLLCFLGMIPALVSLFGGTELLNGVGTTQSQVGAILIHLNPVVVLFAYIESNMGVNSGDLWVSCHLDVLVPWVYLAIGCAFLGATWRTLCGLGAARVRL